MVEVITTQRVEKTFKAVDGNVFASEKEAVAYEESLGRQKIYQLHYPGFADAEINQEIYLVSLKEWENGTEWEKYSYANDGDTLGSGPTGTGERLVDVQKVKAQSLASGTKAQILDYIAAKDSCWQRTEPRVWIEFCRVVDLSKTK